MGCRGCNAWAEHALENIPSHLRGRVFEHRGWVGYRTRGWVEGVYEEPSELEDHPVWSDQCRNIRGLGGGVLPHVRRSFSGTESDNTHPTHSRWGFPFLYESYLYHLHRLDHRHNFSPYFYLTYLTYPPLVPSNATSLTLWSRLLRSPLTSFVPQMTLAFGTGLLFGREKEHLVFTWFVQTVVFVLFNKVCTSQVCCAPMYLLISLTSLILVFPMVSPPFAFTASPPINIASASGWLLGHLDWYAGTMAE